MSAGPNLIRILAVDDDHAIFRRAIVGLPQVAYTCSLCFRPRVRQRFKLKLQRRVWTVGG
jgi:hypothetical protein